MNQGDVLPKATLWRLLGLIILGGFSVLLLTPVWMLPLGRAGLVVQGPPGDRYTVHYSSERPVDYENLSRCIPHLEDWERYDATQYIPSTEYLEPKGQAFWVYKKGNTSVHLMLVWSNKIADLHIPSVCYVHQGYKVLSEKPHEVHVLNTTQRQIVFYANELWVKNPEKDQTREVLYFFIKYGFGRGGRDAYFVRIECVETPQEEARAICDVFAREIFLNIIDFYGVGSSSPEGEGTVLSHILCLGPWAVIALLATIITIIVGFFWFPERNSSSVHRDSR